MKKVSKKTDAERIQAKIVPILKSSGATRAAIFGSAARGEMRKNSDVDILIDIPSTIGLLGFVAIKQRLEKALGRKVDLVEYGGIKPSLKKNILKDQVSVL